MATLQEIEDAIRVAAGKGNKELVRKLGAAREQMIAKGVGGGKAAAPPATEGTDEPGLLQQMFDVRSPSTGESYIYGNRPKPQVIDDLMRIGGDTASRGLTDKLTNTANLTEAARERTPDFIEAPLDITTAVVTSPYRVGSMAAGGVAGGLEGGLSEYGHQKDWVPSAKGMEDIAYESGKGALLGSGAAKAGEWLGKFSNAFRKQPKIGTEDELATAAQRAEKRQAGGKNISPRSEDVIARNARMEAAKMAQAQGPEAFEKMLSGMDAGKWPIDERLLLAQLANPKNMTGKFVEGAGKMLRRKSPFGAIPVIGTGVEMVGGGINALSKGSKQFEALKEAILDVTGQLKKNKANVEQGREYLSKTVVGAGKTDEDRKKKRR
jgi:hypothetical protein